MLRKAFITKNERYRFTKTGTYWVRVTGHPSVDGRSLALKSNTIAITVLPALPANFGDTVFGIHLQSDKPTYKLGEPIALRVSIVNLTDQTYVARNMDVTALSKLLILDVRGNPIGPPAVRGSRFYMAGLDFPPGRTMNFRWTDLSQWGVDLTEPGKYTIVAIANISASRRMPSGVLRDSFVTTDADRSNPVGIEIVR
jgi:hypothetical protein